MSPKRRRSVKMNVHSGCKTRWNYNPKRCSTPEMHKDGLVKNTVIPKSNNLSKEKL